MRIQNKSLHLDYAGERERANAPSSKKRSVSPRLKPTLSKVVGVAGLAAIFATYRSGIFYSSGVGSQPSNPSNKPSSHKQTPPSPNPLPPTQPNHSTTSPTANPAGNPPITTTPANQPTSPEATETPEDSNNEDFTNRALEIGTDYVESLQGDSHSAFTNFITTYVPPFLGFCFPKLTEFVTNPRGLNDQSRDILQAATVGLPVVGIFYSNLKAQIEKGGKSLGHAIGNNTLGRQIEQYPKTSLSTIGGILSAGARIYYVRFNPLPAVKLPGKEIVSTITKISQFLGMNLKPVISNHHNTWKHINAMITTVSIIIAGAIVFPISTGLVGYSISHLRN
jgi:hypothetical protein